MIIIVCLPSLPRSPYYSRELSKPLGMSWKWSDFEGSKKEAESNALVCEKGTVIETSTSYMLTLSSINTVLTHSYNGLPFKSLRNSTHYNNANMNAHISLQSIFFPLIELLHRKHTNLLLHSSYRAACYEYLSVYLFSIANKEMWRNTS